MFNLEMRDLFHLNLFPLELFGCLLQVCSFLLKDRQGIDTDDGEWGWAR